MAEIPEAPEQANPDLAAALKEGGIPVGQPELAPPPVSYKVVGASKIPVSKGMGSLWKSRKSRALKKREENGVEAAWKESLQYYYNDQMTHRTEGEGGEVAGNRVRAKKMDDRMSETENLVFANTNALIPMLYAKNPACAVTVSDPADEQFGRLAQDVINEMLTKKAAPGVGIKAKAKRCVVMSSLTNRSYIEIGWTPREYSTDQHLSELETLSKELSEAKTPTAIREVEGKLVALEEKANFLQPEGPFTKFRTPFDVIVDDEGVEEDLSDSNWIMIGDYLSTAYINAVYAEKDPETGEIKSIYEPTHVLKAAGSGEGVDDASYSALGDATGAKAYGFDDEETFKRCQMTRVWYVWDKITRRVLLYSDKDWCYPIWVWDDPYKLDRFFPLYPLYFFTAPCGGEGKGEVTYYLDQQDAINEINDEERRARYWAKRNLFYNTRYLNKEEAQRFLEGPDGTAVGIQLPEGIKMSDAIFSQTPPSMQFGDLFNPERKIASIDRIAAVNETLRGAQFKTNTTNGAIEYYKSNQATRLDERIDAVEDFLGDICWGLLQLTLQMASKETIAMLVGEEKAAAWPEKMSARDIQVKFQAKIVGGSTTKPTSNVKKAQALEVTQILGQFASASPYALVVALKVMERAYEEMVITQADWQVIAQTIMMQLQRGVSTNSPEQPPAGDGGQPQPGAEPQGEV